MDGLLNAHWHCSWFGRLGAGDIMARYKIGDPKGAYRNLEKISSIIAAQGDIYEGYDMNGCGLAKCGCTTSGYGDYLEHCGGLIWTVTEGVFGISFDSTSEYAAKIEPNFFTTQGWKTASLTTRIRGLDVTIEWNAPTITVSGGDNHGDFDSVNVLLGCGANPSAVVPLAPKKEHSINCGYLFY